MLAQFMMTTLVQAVPFGVALLSARRFALSRSPNAVLYAITAVFALVAGAGAIDTVWFDPAVTAGAWTMSLASVPLWLLVRAACRRPAQAYGTGSRTPVFASSRSATARNELQQRPVTPN